MVKFLLLVLVLPIALVAENVEVKAEILRNKAYEYSPVKGTIMITHPKSKAIARDSFTYQGASLPVVQEKELFLDSKTELVITIFSFELPPQPVGQQMLLPINVKVDNKVYSTLPVLYDVFKEDLPEDFEKPLLRLQAFVEGDSPIYPGQRIKLVYRYYYKGNIQLTKEELPFLYPKGFKQVGEERIKDYEKGGISVREVTLEVQALEPGDYEFAAAYIEGVTQIPGKGEVTLKSSVQPITVTVAPFPEGTQPQTFKGAIGTFTISDKIIGAKKVKVGDRLTVEVTITGEPAQLEQMAMPYLFCQPGFPGMFALDESPAGRIEGNEKVFTLYLRPLNDAVTEIPPIELQFYNPKEDRYMKTVTDSIPIVVESVSHIESTLPKRSLDAQQSVRKEDWAILLRKVPKVQITNQNPIQMKDIAVKHFSSWYVYLIFPLALAGMGGQFYLKRYLEARSKQSRVRSSSEWLEEAEQQQDPAQFYLCIKRALTTLAWEQGKASLPDTAIAEIKDKDIQSLLIDVECQRYGQGKEPSRDEIMQKVHILFKRLPHD